MELWGFFTDKINAIHQGLKDVQESSCQLDPDPEFKGETFSSFRTVSEEDVAKVIKTTAPKTCCLDPMPTQLIKECLDVLIPVITRIINQSFTQGYVHMLLK